MTERSVQLHLRTPTERQDTGMGQASSQFKAAPDQDSQQRFAQAMKASDLAPAAPLPGEPVGQPAASPMGLFGGVPAAAATLKPGLMPLLKDSLKGLQVGQDARSVRLELDESLYPGVSVSVFEDAGAWVAEFRCQNKEAYTELATPAQDMARQLADELQHDALWRVIDESDGPVADNALDHTTEAFASAPQR
jgi:hypothetical protein